ncbi:MAG: branched-chain amino acid ABC transporter permease, partial [Stellaceae bacterium]
VWGVDSYPAYQPAGLLGTVPTAGLPFSGYELALVPLAAAIGGGLIFFLARTRAGKMLRAVIHDREMALTCGIDVAWVYLWTFIAGAVLGALGGAVTAPIISVVPGIGVDVIVLAFAVVAAGGMGSITGSIVGALIVGIARAAAVHLLPQVELFVIYAAMTVVLLLRPEGLFAQAKQRRI